jgi:hypothetical protein
MKAKLDTVRSAPPKWGTAALRMRRELFRPSVSLWWRMTMRSALKTIVNLLIVVAALPTASLQAQDSSKKSSTAAVTTKDLGQRKEGDVGVHEELSYREAKVAAEMTELEQRMFRLSEALKKVEPENSSRLMSGVKYARNELILHQMQEIQAILNKADYTGAGGQQKELLLKLQRLEQLLISADLDLQLQLQRLRLMREIIAQLDTAIKEEDREQKLSDEAAKRNAELQNLPALREKLQELIRRQTEHVESSSALAEKKSEPITNKSPDETAASGRPAEKMPAAEKSPLAKLSAEQEKTRDETKRLEERLADLSDARGRMDKALPLLEKQEVTSALPEQKEALESLKKLLAAMEQKQKEGELALAQERFNAMRKDQEQNRGSTEKISEMVRELGDAGAGAIGELTRATGSMGSAEGQLGNRQAEPAGKDQSDAIGALKFAKEQLEQEQQKLLNRIRAEVKKRVLEGITQMIERQVAVRSQTEKLGPRMKDGSRQVLTAVAALGKSEEQIMQIGDELIALVEETEFGIALPAALRAIVGEMDDVKRSLTAGDASEPVVEAEKQIEADLKALLDAMKQLPSSAKSSDKKPQNNQERERELNRLIAELKMIRILQVRVNHDTKLTDEKREAELSRLSKETERKIQAIHDRQQDVHDVTDKLNTQRGDELQ